MATDKTIHSLKELQLKMPAIIKQYGSNNDFTLIALANPIAALEKTGLTFTDAAKEEIEAHVRFGKDGAQRYSALKESIAATAGAPLDLKNTGLLADTILRLAGSGTALKSKSPNKKEPERPIADIDRARLLDALNTRPGNSGDQWQDRLAAFSSVHPLIPLLLEYRRLEGEHSAFAAPQDIPAIEKKLRSTPLTNVVFSLKRNSTDAPR